MNATLYTKDSCPFCVHAKRLLDSKNIPYTEISAITHREELIQRVTESTGTPPRTVPQIWLDEQYIGGFTDLEAYFRNS